MGEEATGSVWQEQKEPEHALGFCPLHPLRVPSQLAPDTPQLPSSLAFFPSAPSCFHTWPQKGLLILCLLHFDLSSRLRTQRPLCLECMLPLSPRDLPMSSKTQCGSRLFRVALASCALCCCLQSPLQRTWMLLNRVEQVCWLLQQIQSLGR